ncbi:hypothetical protein [Dasania marina]|uniref:hypothetical protein n=1 Tax=Dasania marina TaxID=471499 RepID=UPI00037EB919|nr:hypothetical protein [Dasania marina]
MKINMTKAFTVICIALLSLSSIAYAGKHHDDRPSQEQHHEKRMEKMAKKLALSEQQQQQVAAIFKEQQKQHKAIESATRDKLSTVLSAEQLEKMDKMHGKRRHKEKHDKS